MNEPLQIVIPALVAIICTGWIYPYILDVAKVKNIVDNPNARKLQRIPIPVLGGLTVAFGILSGLMTFNLFGDFTDLLPVLASIFIILIIGFIDDTISLSARVRFVVEIILILYFIKTTGCQLNDFHGLWGIGVIPNYISIPLTVFACVGIINAVNLIDGVDGFSSGYSIVSCALFGIMFYSLGDMRMVALAAIVAASLIPFFLHNVFGRDSKMFIGDAGTLSLGIIFSVFVMTIISSNQSLDGLPNNLGVVPFTLAVLCIPVFDTLRVMSARMLKGRSPFSPDKTHLHHLFLELGYSHIGSALTIIMINLIVVLCWFGAFRAGLSINTQLYVVIVMGVLATFVFYPFVHTQTRKQTYVYRLLRRIALLTHAERKGFWAVAQRWADRKTRENIESL